MRVEKQREKYLIHIRKSWWSMWFWRKNCVSSFRLDRSSIIIERFDCTAVDCNCIKAKQQNCTFMVLWANASELMIENQISLQSEWLWMIKIFLDQWQKWWVSGELISEASVVHLLYPSFAFHDLEYTTFFLNLGLRNFTFIESPPTKFDTRIILWNVNKGEARKKRTKSSLTLNCLASVCHTLWTVAIKR